MNDPLYEPQENLGGLINTVAFRMRHNLDTRLREHGLDMLVWPVLVRLWQNDGVPQAQIAGCLCIPGYAISRGIDRLEAAGMVVRRSDPGNRRVRLVFLTEAGRAIQRVLLPLAQETNHRVLSLLEEGEQAQLLGLLRKIVQGI